MNPNKTIRILINTFLYLALFMAMCCMAAFLSEYRAAGFGAIGRFGIGVAAVFVVLMMLLILDFRNKIFEVKTIWSRNLTSIFFLNLVLSFALWAYTYAHVGSPETGQNGLWCLWGFNNRGWGGSGWENHHYFHPLLGVLGLVILLSTFCNVKYRLKRAYYYKTPIELLPIIVFFILIAYHYNHIPKPYNMG